MQERSLWGSDIPLSIAYQNLQNNLKLQTQNISRRKNDKAIVLSFWPDLAKILIFQKVFKYIINIQYN